MEKEKEALQKIMTDPQDFSNLSDMLSRAVKDAIVGETQELLKAKAALRDKEQESYKEYSEKLAHIEEQRQRTLRDVSEEREQLEADKVYLQVTKCIHR